MNKYTTLLQKYLKIIVFMSLVLGLFLGFGQFFRASRALDKSVSNDPMTYKSAFFVAMQSQDLAEARQAVDRLQALLPPQDPFLTEIIPAYMADLYLQYAQSLRYDKDAYEMMIAQAKLYAPTHPALVALQQAMDAAQPPVEVAALVTEQPIQVPLAVAQVEPVQASPAPEVKDGPPRIPYIDPPPLSVQFPDFSMLEQELSPLTHDPCALSFYSRDHALTPCIDPVGPNRYGPALFVVGNSEQQPLLAFTQQTITEQEYDLFCERSGQCQEEKNPSNALIDLKDVEQTLSDYNAYCQMTATCDKISAPTNKARAPLTRVQVQNYAQWLSKETGYSYHHATAQDLSAIRAYFQQCVTAKTCQPGLLQTLSLLLNQSDTLLVRDVAKKT
jgi:hypothetical protein